MTDRQLLITFDYELFLGNRSGNINDCLFHPTDSILKVIESKNAKAVFFVDTTHLLTLKKNAKHIPACGNDLKRVSDHVASLVQRGHYVYPHLHPHWLDAEYLSASNEWRLNSTAKYRFHHLSEAERVEVFDGSMELLSEIIAPVDPKYKIDGYRAGGWCIQPFADFLPFFQKHHFKYDMSVLGGFYFFSNAQYFDFSNASEKSVYHFSNDVAMEDKNGALTQYNISSIYFDNKIKFLDKLFLKIQYKLFNDHTFNRGEGQIAVKLDNDLFKPATSGHNIMESNWERVAIELLTLPKLGDYIRFFDDHPYMHFISHPKMLTQHNIKMFDRFLNSAYSRYKIETDFKRFL
jgi:hypothetical protein